MTTPRERLEELRALEGQDPRSRLNQLRALEEQEATELLDIAGTASQIRQGFEDTSRAIVEPAITMGTSLAAKIPAGLAGISEGLNPFGKEGSAGELSRKIEESLTIPIQTEAGERGLENFQESMQFINDFIDKLRTGEETLEAGGGPFLATINEMFPDFLGAIFGGLGTRGIGRTEIPEVKTTPGGRIESPLDKTGQIKSDLLNKPEKTTTAKFKLFQGDVVKDPAGRAALAQNWAEEIVSGTKAANEATKTQIRRMVDLAHTRLTGGAKVKLKTRPSNVLGDSMFKRFKFIEGANKASGKLLNKIAENQGPSPIDISGPMKWFDGQLNKLGITRNGKIDFSESSLAKSDFPMIRENIGQIERVLKGNVSFFQAHSLKQIIRDVGVSFEKTVAKKGASDKAQNLFKGLSTRIDKILDTKSKAYDDANIKFKDTIEVLDAYKKVIKNRLFEESASETMGQLMRRLTSNAESRLTIRDLIENTDAVAKKYGGKFEDDIFLQQSIINDMDKVIEVAAGTSIMGELGAQAIQAAQRSTGANVVRAIDRASKIAGIKSERKALDTLRALTN